MFEIKQKNLETDDMLKKLILKLSWDLLVPCQNLLIMDGLKEMLFKNNI
jgi:hypothetical protein